MSINHLNIEQATSSIEVVSPSVIDKLYELAQNPSLDSGSNVQGNLQVVHAYEDAVSYLLNKFPNLQINVTGGTYIRFADANVQSICATNWGDGTGITIAQAAAVSSIGNKFKNNTEITSFDEFKNFTGCHTLSSGAENLGGCTNLKSIDLSNITLLSGVDGYHRGGFENCTSLQNVILNQNLDAIGFMAFYNCKSLININIPNTVTKIYNGAFGGCSNLKTIGDIFNVINIYSGAFINCINLTKVDLSNVEYIEDNAFVNTGITNVVMPKVKTLSTGTDGYSWGCFKDCKQLLTCDFGEYVESIGWGLVLGCNKLLYVIIRTITPPTLAANAFDTGNACPIYVPDDSVESYKSATNWSAYASRIFSLTQFAIDFPNG